MARKPKRRKQNRQEKFRANKKRALNVRIQEATRIATRIPKQQYQRWATGFTPLAPDNVETERDPDYVAFCIAKQLDEWNEFSFLWLRVAAALKLGMYALKPVVRKGIMRPFGQETFTQSIVDGDYEHEFGLRYEADKFLCYLLLGDNPRFREVFGYVLLPQIQNDLAGDLNALEYNIWFAGEPTVDLSERLAKFDLAEVE